MKGRLWFVDVVELSLRPPWRACALLLGVGTVSFFLAGQTLRIAVAGQVGRSLDASKLRWALVLDPTNPAICRRLGLLHCYSVTEFDPAQGVHYLRRAVKLNSRAVSCWLDLGSACESVGSVACADEAFQRALALSPLTPRVWWHAANHHLRTERTEAALLHFQRLLELSPEYAGPTFRLCLRALDDPLYVFQRLLSGGKDTRLKLAYADFLSAQGHAHAARKVWDATVSASPPFPFNWAEPYLERLLGIGWIPEAARVWHDLERLGIVQRPSTEDQDNLVFNGDFEQLPLNAGFDWRFRQVPYVSLDFSDAAAYRGLRCLRVDFTVARNEAYEPVFQVVPVVPNQEYLLTAFVRSESITSDSGPRLRVLELTSPGRTDVFSETTLRTTSWHSVDLKFSTGPQTQSVQLSLWRPRSRAFPGEIGGSFWLDAVFLRPATFVQDNAAKSGPR